MKNLLGLLLLSTILWSSACKPKQEIPQTPMVPQADLAQCQDMVTKLESQLADLQGQLDQMQAQAQQGSDNQMVWESEKADMQAQLESLQSAYAELNQKMQETSDDFGVWFRVQIGAYEKRQIEQNLQTTDKLKLEQEESLQRITLGRFRAYDDAKRLKDHLQTMGVTDAWIASFKDGQRVPIADVKN